jgi:glycosyltransferase involved in cell wall biosynthesis
MGIVPQEIVYIGYVGGLGGEAIQMLELAAGVAARGWPVTVIVPDLPRLREQGTLYESRPHLRIVLTPLIRFDTGMQNPLDVVRLLLPYRRSLLHLHTGDICIPRVTLLGLEAFREPAVFATIHAAYPEMAVGGGRARYWASVTQRRLRRVICPSRHGRLTQIGYGVPEEKALTIYNGVDTAYYAGGDGAAARRHLGIGKEAKLVVFTARLHPQKRPLDALAAFARVAAEAAEAHLVFVGDGPLEAEVRATTKRFGLEERVHLLGHRTDVPDWLAAADIWITTSDAENFSLSVIEAMAAGRPIVGTLCQGNDEILSPEENALTAPVGDVCALGEGLRRLLRDAALRKHLSAAACRTAQRFTRDAMVDRHLSLYEEADA